MKVNFGKTKTDKHDKTQMVQVRILQHVWDRKVLKIFHGVLGENQGEEEP